VDIPAFFILPAGMYAGRQAMKKWYFLGLPVILLVLVFAGCNHDSSPDVLAGTWVSGDGVWRLEAANGSWTQSKSGKELIRGTYISAGDTVIFKFVQVNKKLFSSSNADEWSSFANLTDPQKTTLGGSETLQIPLNGNTFNYVDPDGGNQHTFTKQ
jgi:hypothetical protein